MTSNAPAVATTGYSVMHSYGDNLTQYFEYER